MSAIKLDDLRKGAAEKYPDFEIEMEDGKILAFKAILRLDKKARRAVSAAFDLKARSEALTEEDDIDGLELTIAVLQDVFKYTERTKGDFAALKKWAGNEDLPMWEFLFEQWYEVTDAGEAVRSAS